jgi:hypothetical protein
MAASDEATRQQLELARNQGAAYVKALETMANRVADTGTEQRAGDYMVACAVEKAEGLYHPADGRLEWREPEQENAHIEIAVRDGADERFVPGLTVEVSVRDAAGREVGRHSHPFLWHPWLHHYGRNWELPGDGRYTIRVHIAPPTFARHDRENGRRFVEAVDVEFSNLQIQTGRK